MRNRASSNEPVASHATLYPPEAQSTGHDGDEASTNSTVAEPGRGGAALAGNSKPAGGTSGSALYVAAHPGVVISTVRLTALYAAE